MTDGVAGHSYSHWLDLEWVAMVDEMCTDTIQDLHREIAAWSSGSFFG
jgi:hypothetical protein